MTDLSVVREQGELQHDIDEGPSGDVVQPELKRSEGTCLHLPQLKRVLISQGRGVAKEGVWDYLVGGVGVIGDPREVGDEGDRDLVELRGDPQSSHADELDLCSVYCLCTEESHYDLLGQRECFIPWAVTQ